MERLLFYLAVCRLSYPLPHRRASSAFRLSCASFFCILYNRKKLLSKLSPATADSLLLFLRTALSLQDGIFGAVMTIQTFGDYAKWHPHIHAIVTDGLFRRSGVFHVMPGTKGNGGVGNGGAKSAVSFYSCLQYQ